jgi:hypothetical protein
MDYKATASAAAMEKSSPRRTLIQLLPRLKPERCGISDQAVLLARELKDGFGIDSAFIVLNSDERCNVSQPVIYCRASNLLESCLELTQGRDGAVLAHVSGYGYSADGAPTLLAEGVEEVKRSGLFCTAAYFHETFASGWPWNSAFWHSRRQQTALRKLVACCQLIVTNTSSYAEWLGRASQLEGEALVELLPVYSAAGETDTPVPFSRRNAAMAVFGLPGTRIKAYRKIAEWDNLADALGIEEIYDIGPECETPSELNGIRVRSLGLLSVQDLAAAFRQARFGFTNYHRNWLGKSSVFASYCAQGLVPVMAEPFSGQAEGLRDGVHVVSVRTAEAACKAGLEKCGHAAWSWYRSHSVHVHAARYARWMRESQ